jgi:FMN reductase [NAD(P)H]
MEEFITLFNLPKKTLLLVGTTIGVPTEQAKNAPLKPRVALDSFVMENCYDSDKVRSSALTYEKEFKEFREKTGSSAVPSYSEKIVSNYTDGFYRKTGKVFEAQGFAFKDE